MSDLLGQLQHNTTALNLHAAGLEVTGKNLARVNDPNYARLRVDRTADLYASENDLGHNVIRQMRDTVLDANVVRERSSGASLQAQQETLAEIDNLLRETLNGANRDASLDGAESINDQANLTSLMSDFFGSFQTLAENPQDNAARAEVISKAQSLADHFNRLDQGLADVSNTIDARAQRDVTQANELITEIANLNKQIARYEGTSGKRTATDLRDSRQKAIESLSGILDISTQPNAANPSQTDVLAGDGTSLVAGPNAATTLQWTPQGNGTSLLTAGGGAALTLGGGALFGYQQARDGALTTAQNQLDALAGQFVTSVNGTYSQGGTLGNFFDAAGTLQLDPSVNATTLRATATANGGANEIALALGELGTFAHSTATANFDGTFSNFAQGIAAGVSAERLDIETKLEHQSLVEEMVTARRNSSTGVNLNEEVSEMMKQQRAFEASARITATIDRMLEIAIHDLSAT